MILMYPYFIALVIYLLIKVCMCSTLSYEVARIFFLQAHAGIFCSSSISCMNFFLDLTPLPGYLMVHPLHNYYNNNNNNNNNKK